MVERLKAAYNGLEPDSDIAKVARETIANSEKVLEAYANAVADATDNYRNGAEQKNNAQEGEAMYSTRANYDYTKSFAEQVDDWKNGRFPGKDALLVGTTPKVFLDLGLARLPVTINQAHVEYAVNGTKDIDHESGEALLKQLPQLMQTPVAIIPSETHPYDSLTAILEAKNPKNGKPILFSAQVDGISSQNGKRLDAFAIKTIFGKGNAYTKLLWNAINNEFSNGFGLYYWDKNKATAYLAGAGLQLPGRSKINNGFVNKIADAGSPVKPKFSNVTETQQFKRWFGDWQNHPENASKVVNEDGTPKVVYHGTASDFTVFDRSQIGKYTERAIYNPKTKHFENVKDTGFFFTTDRSLAQDHAAGAAGESENEAKPRVIEAYLDIKKPLVVEVDEWYARKKIFTAEDWYDKNVDSIISDFNDGDYDGIIIKNPVRTDDEMYVVQNSNQIKSATDNIGTFDGNNNDTLHSSRKPNGESTTSKQQEITIAEMEAQNRSKIAEIQAQFAARLEAQKQEAHKSYDRMKGIYDAERERIAEV